MADTYIEDGFLIEEFDGGRTKKCITEECIRENYETGGNTEKCSCGSCVGKRLNKEGGLNENGWSVDELEERLPDDIFRQVVEELDLGGDVEKQFGSLPRSPYEMADTPGAPSTVEEGQANQLDAFYGESS